MRSKHIMEITVRARRARFGDFDVDLRSGELHKHGVRLKLQDQPFQVLALLLERPGDLVTRDELRQKLWPADTFVDFDTGLNNAIKKLRDALGDSAEKPRYIETLPRRGYRFIARVENGAKPAPPGTEDKHLAPTLPAERVVLAAASSPVILTPAAAHWKWIAVLATLLLAAAIARGIWWSRSGREVPSVPPSIAVLPFVDLSPNKDQEYFSDGLTEEVSHSLAKIPELHVAGRTSAFQFKGKNEDLRVIGQKLNVATVLEGSVRKEGSRVRITAQLVNVADGFHLWSETYDRELSDIFKVQAEIARAVAGSLKVTLVKENAAQTVMPHRHVEAYNAYLQGQYFQDRRSKENLEKAISYYKQAIHLDAGYARAWAGLADAHNRQADLGYLPAVEGYARAREAAERALVLDPSLAEAHAAMGWIKLVFDWDWAGAEAFCRRALALGPGNLGAIRLSGYQAATLGRFEEALALARRAIALDPLSVRSHLKLAHYSYYAGRLEEAAATLKHVLELNRDLPGVHSFISRVYLLQGRAREALAEMEQEPELVWRLYGQALAFHALGRKKESDAAQAELINQFREIAAFPIAVAYAFRGENDAAFDWLERAYAQRDPGLTEIKGEPLLKNIERDARYAAFLKKMNLPLQSSNTIAVRRPGSNREGDKIIPVAAMRRRAQAEGCLCA